MVAYKRPQTIATLLTNYKIMTHKTNVEERSSYPSYNCLLCNRSGQDGMVEKTNFIKSEKDINLKNFGIYAAKCSECK